MSFHVARIWGGGVSFLPFSMTSVVWEIIQYSMHGALHLGCCCFLQWIYSIHWCVWSYYAQHGCMRIICFRLGFSSLPVAWQWISPICLCSFGLRWRLYHLRSVSCSKHSSVDAGLFRFYDDLNKNVELKKGITWYRFKLDSCFFFWMNKYKY